MVQLLLTFTEFPSVHGWAQQSFSQFFFNALPQIRVVSPSIDNLRKSHNLDQGNFNSLSASLSSFIESKTKVSLEHGWAQPNPTTLLLRRSSTASLSPALIRSRPLPGLLLSGAYIIFSALHLWPDSFGRFGKYGGKYVPETLMHALTECESSFYSLAKDAKFQYFAG